MGTLIASVKRPCSEPPFLQRKEQEVSSWGNKACNKSMQLECAFTSHLYRLGEIKQSGDLKKKKNIALFIPLGR